MFQYRNQNVRFVFDFIGKINVCIRTGSVQKGWDFLFAERPKEFPQDIDLHKVTIKGTCVYQELIKLIFKVNGKFSGKKKKKKKHTNFPFRFYFAISCRSHIDWHVVRKFFQENFMTKNYFFSPKNTHDFQATVVVFIITFTRNKLE